MAQIGKKRTVTGLRIDPDFKKWVEDMSRMKAAQERDHVTPARITQAMYNQYLKYPNLIEEIKRTKLGKWKPL